MIVCIEMVPFSIFFHWAYDVGAYDLSKARPLPLAHMGASGTNSPHDPENGYHRVDQYQMEQQKLQQDYYNHPAANGGAYYGGVLGIKALMTVVNPMEILRAIQFGFSMRSESRRMNRNVAVGPPAY